MLGLPRLIRAGAKLRIEAPGSRLLRHTRRTASNEAADAAREKLEALGGHVSSEEFSRVVDAAMTDMRQRAFELASGRSMAHRLVAQADKWWSGTTESEYVDDPNLPEDVRRQCMEDLDEINQTLQNYQLFLQLLRPFLSAAGPTSLLDLAAGHGGFPLAVAREARQQGIDLDITVTDIMREYLDIGAERARAEGLAMTFLQQDALDLSNLKTGQYDIVVCTQSLHHFSPGRVALMFREAARVARKAVLFVDGNRNIIKGALLNAYLRLHYRHPVTSHDAWVSFRRFFVPEELALLAKLAIAEGDIEARWEPPGHCALLLRKDQRSVSGDRSSEPVAKALP